MPKQIVEGETVDVGLYFTNKYDNDISVTLISAEGEGLEADYSKEEVIVKKNTMEVKHIQVTGLTVGENASLTMKVHVQEKAGDGGIQEYSITSSTVVIF